MAETFELLCFPLSGLEEKHSAAQHTTAQTETWDDYIGGH